MTKSREEIISAIRTGGVVGAGGGGFPTHAKLNTKVDTVIANGSECEPMLASDKVLMKLKADRIVDGLKLAMTLTEAKNAIIAVKGHYHEVVNALEKSLDRNITIHKLTNYYPAGDEFMLVYDLTKKVIPEGGLPLNVGVVVSNVLSLVQISDAIDGKVVTDRFVTINGEVNHPQVINVPIGTTYRDLINMAGGASRKDLVWIDGGPMMGNIINDLDDGIGKTTSGVIGLAQDNFVVRQKQTSLKQMVKLSKTACCQCFRCTDLCPRNLIGHKLFPHMTMRTIDYNLSEPKQHITSAFLCSQCGTCEMIACDFMLLSPKKIYAAYRKELVKKGVKNPHTRSNFEPHSQIENRKVSNDMVTKKLGISQYSNDLPFAGKCWTEKVRIPIGRHIGQPAQIKVKLPVSEMIGWSSDLRSATEGRGVSSLVDQLFERVPNDMQNQVIKRVRERKGLAENQ